MAQHYHCVIALLSALRQSGFNQCTTYPLALVFWNNRHWRQADQSQLRMALQANSGKQDMTNLITLVISHQTNCGPGLYAQVINQHSFSRAREGQYMNAPDHIVVGF